MILIRRYFQKNYQPNNLQYRKGGGRSYLKNICLYLLKGHSQTGHSLSSSRYLKNLKVWSWSLIENSKILNNCIIGEKEGEHTWWNILCVYLQYMCVFLFEACGNRVITPAGILLCIYIICISKIGFTSAFANTCVLYGITDIIVCASVCKKGRLTRIQLASSHIIHTQHAINRPS